MFNKSALFNRKEPISQRETVLPESTTGSGLAANGKPLVRTATPVKESTNPAKTDMPLPPASVANPAVSKENTISTMTKESKESKEKKEEDNKAGANTEMGARLVVGSDVKLKGAQILDCDTLVVEGYVEATMDSRVIRISEHGSFNGKVSVDVAEIHGIFEGELTARLQLIIHSTARVKGSIRYGKLMADEGCELCGDINVLTKNSADKLDFSSVSAT